jgi:hypothetical protein
LVRTTTVGFAVAVIAAACSGAAPAAPTQTASSSSDAATALATPAESPTAQATGMAVRSERYGYSLTLPPGWQPIRPARLDWDAKSPPYIDVPGMDVYTGTGWLVAAAHPTSDKLSQWSAAALELVRERFGFECGQMKTGDTTVDGAPAITMLWLCPIYYVQNMYAVHAGRGYVLAFGVPHSEGAGAREMFSALLESFRFGD